MASSTVGDPIEIVYLSAESANILLQKDLPMYRDVAIGLAIGVGVTLLGVLLFAVPWVPVRVKSTGGLSELREVGELREVSDFSEVRELSSKAIGPNNYPTVRIGLKEALLLLHLRRTDDPMTDQPNLRANPRLLHDHMVLAAMLMELVASNRIEVRPRHWGSASIVVLDPTPVGEPDIDELLRQMGTSTQLRRVYSTHSRRLVARLIAQLRLRGYVRLHEPQSGRFVPRRKKTSSLLGQWLGSLVAPLGFDSGSVVLDDRNEFAYLWYFLYTTHNEAEERMFEQMQAAIATRGTSDEFTRRLLILVAALYGARPLLQPNFPFAKNIYRFYPPKQQWEIRRFARGLAEAASPSEQAIFELAAETDERIENPPSAD